MKMIISSLNLYIHIFYIHICMYLYVKSSEKVQGYIFVAFALRFAY